MVKSDIRQKHEVVNSSEDLNTVSLLERIASIQNYCFKRSNIKRVTIPKSVKSIGNSVFSECENLISITLREGLECIS